MADDQRFLRRISRCAADRFRGGRGRRSRCLDHLAVLGERLSRHDHHRIGEIRPAIADTRATRMEIAAATPGHRRDRLATGFKGGGINPRPYFATQAVPFNPETVRTFEAGVKTDLSDRRIRANLTAFTTKYSDMQLLITRCDSLSPFPDAPCTQTTNAGDSGIKRLEFEGDIPPTDRLSLDLSASLLDFQYKSVNPASNIGIDNDLPFVTKRKLSVGAQYKFDFLGGTLTPRLDYDYRSGFVTEAVPNPGRLPVDLGRVSGRGFYNARIVYAAPDSRW